MSKVNFRVCVENKGYEASLQLRSIYPVLFDSTASKRGMLRVIDEDGEDYLYPEAMFESIHIRRDSKVASFLTKIVKSAETAPYIPHINDRIGT